MLKLKHLALSLFTVFIAQYVWAQPYEVQYTVVDTSAALVDDPLQLQRKFTTQANASEYIVGLPRLLQSKGYIAASVDSFKLDSAAAFVKLFLGPHYKWAQITSSSKNDAILNAVRWPAFENNVVDFELLQTWQKKILNYLEANGHPFAKVYLDSITIDGAQIQSKLQIDKGPLYVMDSIRVYGNVNISNTYLQRYLGIYNGSPYNSQKLQQVSSRLKELSFLEEEQPATVSMLGTGSILNLYLKERKNSQVNVLVGLLPNTDVAAAKRFLVTGEANVLLKNALGAGETIGLNWQQLQVKSPRLNLAYNHPFIFNSPLGLNVAFDMFRKDSSFLNINMQLGATYFVEVAKSATLFLQRRSSVLTDVDTVAIKRFKTLPQSADINSTSLGLNYIFNNTDYRLNPRKGSDFVITALAGTKKIKENNQIVTLTDPNFNFKNLYDSVNANTYQLRLQGAAAHYFPVGKLATIKAAIHAGAFFSERIFYNELFQIGGYKLLRGFTEESEYLSQYTIGTLEYRYLIGANSAFFGFVDGGWGRNPLQAVQSHNYIGTGVGLNLETGAGIFNIVWAIGKRNDTDLNLRQSKVHIGFVNYF